MTFSPTSTCPLQRERCAPLPWGPASSGGSRVCVSAPHGRRFPGLPRHGLWQLAARGLCGAALCLCQHDSDFSPGGRKGTAARLRRGRRGAGPGGVRKGSRARGGESSHGDYTIHRPSSVPPEEEARSLTPTPLLSHTGQLMWGFTIVKGALKQLGVIKSSSHKRKKVD